MRGELSLYSLIGRIDGGRITRTDGWEQALLDLNKETVCRLSNRPLHLCLELRTDSRVTPDLLPDLIVLAQDCNSGRTLLKIFRLLGRLAGIEEGLDHENGRRQNIGNKILALNNLAVLGSTHLGLLHCKAQSRDHQRYEACNGD